MIDPRTGKTYYLSWDKWVEFCEEHGEHPEEICRLGFDLGGGNSYTVACYDKPVREAG